MSLCALLCVDTLNVRLTGCIKGPPRGKAFTGCPSFVGIMHAHERRTGAHVSAHSMVRIPALPNAIPLMDSWWRQRTNKQSNA